MIRTIRTWQVPEFEAVVWLRGMLEYFRQAGILARVAVGGQGGHLSPEYFDYLLFPRFSKSAMKDVARMYWSHAQGTHPRPSLDTFVEWHRRRNSNLGVVQLDGEMKAIQRRLSEVVHLVIAGEDANLDIDLDFGATA